MKKRAIIIELLIWFIILIVLFFALLFFYLKVCVEPNIYNIDFKDIDGITKGSPVRFMGINVGHVRSLKSENKHIRVQIIITNDNMKIPQGTMARVEFYGLGGSKSIELMPPDGSCDVGILTSHTIRLAEIAKEVFNIVEIIEGLEKYVKGINKSKAQAILETVEKTKDNRITDTNNNIDNINTNISNKFKDVKNKQKEMNEAIKKTNESVEKINQFVKK